MKKVLGVHGSADRHWVGDGFPVRTLFSYDQLGADVSPFLLLDFAGPHTFEPAAQPRGVGQHPHRGFETVTIVYDGEVAHSDSTGGGGVIGPGDVQWMTAAGGILHEEFHSAGFMRAGGMFRMVQLWVNLPAKHKMHAPRYQSILAASIPSVELRDGAGHVRVVAGAFEGRRGPAETFTQVNVWDVRLDAGAATVLPCPEGHTSLLVVLAGAISVAGSRDVCEAEVVMLDRQGDGAAVRAKGGALVLVLTGEPITEPIVGHGPFVMNTEAEIRQAFGDFRAGRFGAATHV